MWDILNTLTFRGFNRKDSKFICSIDARAQQEETWGMTELFWYSRQPSVTIRLAIIAELPVGFLVYETCPTHYEIIKIVVDPTFQRKRVGTGLLEHMRSEISFDSPDILMTVRESNVGMQCFLRHCGFFYTETLRDAYTEPKEDCYVMRFNIVHHATRNDPVKNRISQYFTKGKRPNG